MNIYKKFYYWIKLGMNFLNRQKNFYKKFSIFNAATLTKKIRAEKKLSKQKN